MAVRTGLTPLVGREEELGLLQRALGRRPKQGAGQVVLLSGEPGIGKSRLVQELKEQVCARRGDPHRVSLLALSPEQCLLSDHRAPAAAPPVCARGCACKPSWRNSNTRCSHYRFPQADTLPLLAALLSLPHPEGYSTAYAQSAETEAEDPGSLSGVAGRGSGEGCRVLCLGRSALGRSLHAGGAHALPGPSAHDAAVGAADLSPRVHAALGQPLAPQPADAQPLRTTAGRGDGRASDAAGRRCRQKWCSRLWPRPMACRCLSKS